MDSPVDKDDIIQRLTRVETLLEHHLKNSERTLNYLLFPTLVGVVLIVAKLFLFGGR